LHAVDPQLYHGHDGTQIALGLFHRQSFNRRVDLLYVTMVLNPIPMAKRTIVGNKNFNFRCMASSCPYPGPFVTNIGTQASAPGHIDPTVPGRWRKAPCPARHPGRPRPGVLSPFPYSKKRYAILVHIFFEHLPVNTLSDGPRRPRKMRLEIMNINKARSMKATTTRPRQQPSWGVPGK
jgi:hypothetical protein